MISCTLQQAEEFAAQIPSTNLRISNEGVLVVWDYTLDTMQTFNEQDRSSTPLHHDSNDDQDSSTSTDESSDPDVGVQTHLCIRLLIQLF